MTPSRDPGLRPVALAFLAGLLPGAGIVVLGLVLLAVVRGRTQEEVDRESRREAEALAARAAEECQRWEDSLEQRLTRPPRLPTSDGPARRFDLVRADRGPWGLPAPRPTWPLAERADQEGGLDLTAFLPAVEELEFQRQDARTAAERYRDLARFSPPESAEAARFLLAEAAARGRAGQWRECLAVWDQVADRFLPDASVDGVPLALTTALQQIAARRRLAGSTEDQPTEPWAAEARARARDLLVALDQDQVPLPHGMSAAVLRDARRELAPYVEQAPPFQGSLREEDLALRQELEQWGASLPEPVRDGRDLAPLQGAPGVRLLRSDPRSGRIAGVWLPLAGLTSLLAPTAEGLRGRFLLPDEGPGTADVATVPGLEGLRANVTADPDLVRRRLAPWRLAVGTGVAMVGLMSLASAFLASLAVQRRLRFARLQGDLVASISHELRTPLTAMLLNLELLEDPRLEQGRRQDHTRRARQSAERLQRMVERVLAFARTGRGQDQRRPEAVPVGELFDAACDELGALLPADQVRREVAPGLPPVFVDRDDLVQVLVGLLDNAARHATGTRPTLRAAMGGDGTVRVEVADDGPGIPEAERRSAFEPFHRAAAPARQSGPRVGRGVGLGLAIAKGLVEAAGGRIEALPTHPGVTPEGLTIRLRLPAAPAAPTAPGEAP